MDKPLQTAICRASRCAPELRECLVPTDAAVQRPIGEGRILVGRYHRGAHNISYCSVESAVFGGEGGIRTPDTVARMPHFECGAFNHSATSPQKQGTPSEMSDGGPGMAAFMRRAETARNVDAGPRRHKTGYARGREIFCTGQKSSIADAIPSRGALHLTGRAFAPSLLCHPFGLLLSGDGWGALYEGVMRERGKPVLLVCFPPPLHP